jgi:intein/homing endonuclease
MLQLNDHYRYPRTFHFEFSENLQNDDRMLHSLSALKDRRIIVSEKLDGENCVDKNTIIETDNGKKAIGELCENGGKDIKVASYNEFENKIEFKEILKYHDNLSDQDEWYEIELEDGTTLRLTGNHRVYLPEKHCYRKEQL